MAEVLQGLSLTIAHGEHTAILGPNGAGKTTIIEAVAWALFDLLAYKKDEFLTRGAKKGSVRVTFESSLDEREYSVYRDTMTGYYVYDPQLGFRIAEKKEEVTRFLWQHLGVEPGTDLVGGRHRHVITPLTRSSSISSTRARPSVRRRAAAADRPGEHPLMRIVIRRLASGALVTAALASCDSTALTTSGGDRVLPAVTVSSEAVVAAGLSLDEVIATIRRGAVAAIDAGPVRVHLQRRLVRRR